MPKSVAKLWRRQQRGAGMRLHGQRAGGWETADRQQGDHPVHLPVLQRGKCLQKFIIYSKFKCFSEQAMQLGKPNQTRHNHPLGIDTAGHAAVFDFVELFLLA